MKVSFSLLCGYRLYSLHAGSMIGLPSDRALAKDGECLRSSFFQKLSAVLFSALPYVDKHLSQPNQLFKQVLK